MPIPLDRYGVYWSAVILRGMQALRAVPAERILHVDFKSLTRKPREVLSRICSFIGLDDPETAWLNEVSMFPRQVPARQSQLAKPDRDKLERACLPGLRVLNGAELGG